MPEALSIDRAIERVKEEWSSAVISHAPFNSAHEGYAVLLEEVDELWDEVRKNRRLRDKQRMRNECAQIAAMALRFMTELCAPESAEST